MRLTFDDQYLVTVSEDSCVMIWKVQDKERGGMGRTKDKEVGYAEEILITKSDLEEKVIYGHYVDFVLFYYFIILVFRCLM